MPLADLIIRALVGLVFVGFFSVFCLVLLNKRLARDVDQGYNDTFEPRDAFSGSTRKAFLMREELVNANPSGIVEVRGTDVVDKGVLTNATRQRSIVGKNMPTREAR